MNARFDKQLAGLQIAWDEDGEVEFLGRAALSGQCSYTAAKCLVNGKWLSYLYPVAAQKERNVLLLTYDRNPDAWSRSLGWDLARGTLKVEFRDTNSVEPLNVWWRAEGATEPVQLVHETEWTYIAEGEVVSIPFVPRGKVSVSRHERPGQAELRTKLIAEHGSCQITLTKTLFALEACHILPVKNGGVDVIGNALLLRRDLHTLFDLGLLTFRPGSGGWQVCIHESIEDDDYRKLAKTVLPNSVFDRHQPYLDARASVSMKQ